MPLLSFLQSSKPADINDLTREKIQAQSTKLRLSDSDLENKLDLYCYNRCNNDEADLVKNCRGVVFSGEHIVLRGFPYTEEYTTESSSFNIIKNIMKESWDSYRFFESREGALLRVFYWQSKWYVSTHRKLDAFRSKWASKESFGQMFNDALESLVESNNENFINHLNKSSIKSEETITNKFLDTLDKNYQYMFLVMNNYDNRIVCVAPDKAVVYHVGTIPLSNTNPPSPQNECILNHDIGIPFSKELHFSDIDVMKTYIDELNYENYQGVIIFDTKRNKQYKIFNQDYFDLFNIRGNEPSVKYRYLQIRQDKDMVDKLYYLYPKYADAFDDYENTLYECAKKINKNYIDRFIKKKYVTVPKEDFMVMKACHEWHLQDREKNRISLRKVIDTLNEQTPSCLNRIIRRFKSGIQTDDTHIKMTRLRARSYSHNSDNVQPMVTSGGEELTIN
jgi:hypothetical protein